MKNCCPSILNIIVLNTIPVVAALSIVFVAIVFALPAFAQDFIDFRAVGNGIEVTPDGSVLPLSKEKTNALGKMVESLHAPIPTDLDRSVSRRTISLKKLDAEVNRIVEQYGTLPDTIRNLAGLTSIDYIVAVPEENDLLLIGPAEGWHPDALGNIVGSQNRRPVLQFEDFLVALRLWGQATAPRMVGVSIEPAQDSAAKLVQIHRQFTNINENNADAYAAALEEAYGNASIVITGFPANSRTARILAAADFKMKRIALGLDSSETRNVSSYVSMITAPRTNISPRFVLSPEYATITHDSTKSTWKLGNVTVRVTHRRDSTGMDRTALNWCKNFEDNYETLTRFQPIFGELRNNMQFALIAALIHQEKLLEKANCNLTILLDESKLKLLDYSIPRTVAYQSIKSQNGFSTIVACGAIEINPMGALRNNVRLDNKIDSERTRLIQTIGTEWWSH